MKKALVFVALLTLAVFLAKAGALHQLGFVDGH